jgi:hypothetical protein
LAIQYWEIYTIVNEQNITLKNAWDGENLRFTFRRTVNSRLMTLWLELKQIASNIQLDGDNDTIIWQFNLPGKYSVQSLYVVVNDRGVRQIFTLVVWEIPVPSRLHVFLWLLCNNKVLTRDNLAKRRKVDNMYCLFCNEQETVSHLIFDCCVAKVF